MYNGELYGGSDKVDYAPVADIDVDRSATEVNAVFEQAYAQNLTCYNAIIQCQFGNNSGSNPLSGTVNKFIHRYDSVIDSDGTQLQPSIRQITTGLYEINCIATGTFRNDSEKTFLNQTLFPIAKCDNYRLEVHTGIDFISGTISMLFCSASNGANCNPWPLDVVTIVL